MRDFVFSPPVNNSFTVLAPIKTMNETSHGQFAVLKVFLNMLCRMVARRNILASAMRTVLKVNVNCFVYFIGLLSEMSLMTKWSSSFLRIFRGLFLFIFCKRVFERVDKLLFKMRVGVFKFLNASLKLYNLTVGKVHREFEFIDSAAKIFSVSKDNGGIFAIEKYAKVTEGTVRAFDVFPIINLSILPTHFKSQSKKLKCQNSIKRIQQNKTNRMRVGGYFYR
jgi:hypothetical protein